MSLTDVVSGMDITILTQAALVLFLVCFAALIGRLFMPSRRNFDAYQASLPLQDDNSPAA